MKLAFLMLLSLTVFSCKQNDTSAVDGTDASEVAQQVGDIMASVDEAGGNTGSIATLEINSLKKSYARLAPEELNESNPVARLFLPEAQAAACSAASGGFGACTGTTMTRTLNNCTVGSVIFSGTVSLSWSGTGVTTCAYNQSTNVITRVPNLTAEGRRGLTLSVTKSGATGQTLTWASGVGATRVLQYYSDGIRRRFTSSTGNTIFDFVTRTTTAVNVNNLSRTDRTLNGGAVEVKNNVSGMTCTFVPTNVAWTSATCNCPTSGTWSGSCVDSSNATTSATVAITGCGTGNYTQGTTVSSVNFDRCASN